MNPSPNRWLYVLGATLTLAILFLSVPLARIPAEEIAYSEFKELVARGQVEEVTLQGREATATLTAALPIGPANAPTLTVRTRVPAFGDRASHHHRHHLHAHYA